MAGKVKLSPFMQAVLVQVVAAVAVALILRRLAG